VKSEIPDGRGLLKVRFRGAELRYAEAGEGETVVFVHGGFADYRMWGPLFGVVSRGFRAVSYSRRGAYPSETSAAQTSIPLHSADLAALISHLSKSPVHLVGESYGGCVAVHCAIHNPGMVATLTIDEPPMLPLLEGDEALAPELRRFERSVLGPYLEGCSAGRWEAAARVLVRYLEGSPRAYDSLSEAARRVVLENSGATYADIKGGFEGVTREELRRLRPPTLLVKSGHGPALLSRIVDLLGELIPNRTMKTIEGTTHGTVTGVPGYTSSVLEFISRGRMRG
jgi:pimeloyl-ACP methyl ester carboxylesterase